MRDRIFSSAFYQMTLNGGGGKALRFVPRDPWAGEAEIGLAILRGEFQLGPQKAVLGSFGFIPETVGPRALAALHGYSWLRDLRASSDDNAAARARELTDSWLEWHSRWDAVAWRTAPLAERLTAWLYHFDFLSAAADPAFVERLTASLTAQARHLRRAKPEHPLSAEAFRVIKARLYCDLCLPGFEKRLGADLDSLEKEIGRQLWPDGGQIERNPEALAQVLEDLLEIRATLLDARQDVPQTLQTAIDRIVPLLRALRHGDGQLALFNGGTPGRRPRLDAVFAQTKSRGKPLTSAPHSGFHRLAAGRTVLIVDAGAPPVAGADTDAHAGTLSFEMSVGKDRVIVNCGAYPEGGGRWSRALRTTAAHSTLVVDDTNSAEIHETGGIGRRPSSVDATRRESDGSLFLEASHNGYLRRHGLSHRRALFLSADGADLRGEDELTGTGDKPFAVRFHLHPRVHASLLPDGGGVLLKVGSGAGWRFRASGGEVTLEESIYAGDGFPRRTEQIVVSGATEKGAALVKWRFNRT